ncbi:Phospholipase/carboxylesterase/thioesterase, partial [Lophiotrema nucula]
IFPTVKWVFACAAERWAGTEQEIMCQWFDMASVCRPNERMDVQAEGLKESVKEIVRMLREEAETVGRENVLLAGISQGDAVAVCALLCGGWELGGFIGISTWLPHQDHGNIENLEITLETPVLVTHSEDDEVVPIENGVGLSEGLIGLGMEVEFKCYGDGGHWVDEPEGIDDIVKFI